MKKNILYILSLIFIYSFCMAGSIQQRQMSMMTLYSAAGGGGGGPDTYYYGVGSDDYPNNSSWSSFNGLNGDNITVLQAGTITTIGVKFNSASASGYKVLLYTNSASWTIEECVTESSNSTGWNDSTLVTPYSVGTDEVVAVQVIVDIARGVNRNGTSGGLGDSSMTDYANACTTTGTLVNDYQAAVRIYVD